jgi:hypothetical protein
LVRKFLALRVVAPGKARHKSYRESQLSIIGPSHTLNIFRRTGLPGDQEVNSKVPPRSTVQNQRLRTKSESQVIC